jgi:hypothetical protein
MFMGSLMIPERYKHDRLYATTLKIQEFTASMSPGVQRMRTATVSRPLATGGSAASSIGRGERQLMVRG